jgi:hypothetical protein
MLFLKNARMRLSTWTRKQMNELGTHTRAERQTDTKANERVGHPHTGRDRQT